MLFRSVSQSRYAGQYALSPLSQISGLLTGLGAFMGSPTGTTGTTGGTTQQSAISNILGLPQAAFDQLMSLGRSIGLPLKDGGMASYAKGGNVKKPVPENFQKYLKLKAKRNS